MKLSEHFTTGEFECRCGCGFGSRVEDIEPNLIRVLERMRVFLDRPMIVTSGARCATHNEEVGGKPNSAHLPDPETGKCRAVGILTRDGGMRWRYVHAAKAAGFRRIGVGDNFTHLDVAHGGPYVQDWIWTY